MASHFSSVGVPAEVPLGQVIGHATTTGTGTTVATGMQVFEWTDASGAAVAVVVGPDARVACAKPFLAHTARPARVRPTHLAEDAECPWCAVLQVEVLGDDDEMVFPLGVELPDLAVALPALELGVPTAMQVGGIAERFELFADEAAYRASGTPFAVRSLVPSGLFAPGVVGGGDRAPVRAEAMLSGTVSTARRRRNERFGGTFWAVVVDTLQIQVDLAVDPDLVTGPPEEGQICSATAWLVGRLG